MPSLEKTLRGYDMGYLRILAERWGLDFPSGEAEAVRKELSARLCDPSLAEEMLDALPDEARAALDALMQQGGRIPRGVFTRRFGEIREMGPGRRDREKPHLHPVSTAEYLFYRAFIARAFFDTEDGPQEFVYIPDEFRAVIPQPRSAQQDSFGRLARPEEYAYPRDASDRLLDDATTFLAARRAGNPLPEGAVRVPQPFLEALLRAAGLVDDRGVRRDAVKVFLTQPRAEAFASLLARWTESAEINELRLMPHLRFEGVWKNDPLAARRFVREILASLPQGKWWHLPSLIDDVRANLPDFQRAGGEYESWFIRRAADGESLQGFEHWEEVDGALIRYLITEAMYWLGLVDLAAGEKEGEILAFRVRAAQPSAEEMERRTVVSSQAVLSIPRLASRAFRYQIARFCAWLPSREADVYRYQLTPQALTLARKENLEPRHFLALMRKHVQGEIPPSVTRALHRWALNGTEARVESVTLLRLASPEVRERIRNSRAERFLGEEISPTDVVLRKNQIQKFLAALAEAGILGEDRTNDV